MSVARSKQTSKDRLMANAFIVLLTVPALYLIWHFQKKPAASGGVASNLTP